MICLAFNKLKAFKFVLEINSMVFIFFNDNFKGSDFLETIINVFWFKLRVESKVIPF